MPPDAPVEMVLNRDGRSVPKGMRCVSVLPTVCVC
jgi:hypothetical protein